MFTNSGGNRVLAILGAIGMAAGLSGCAAKVTRDDFNAEVARLREEVKAGDAELEFRACPPPAGDAVSEEASGEGPDEENPAAS